jgi:hypothetical protein
MFFVENNNNLLESGTGRGPAQAPYKDVIMPNNSKRSRSFSRAGCGPWEEQWQIEEIDHKQQQRNKFHY